MDVNFLSMMEARLPPGFRFHPRDEELIDDYLARRIAGDQSNGSPLMVDVDLNQVEPWDLPATARVGKEWYFYSQRDRKYATGQRTNRATRSGYWKATGKDRHVADDRREGKLVGMRKTLVFYKGRAPKGKKTDWVMHEFRRLEADLDLDLDLDRPRPLPHSPSSTSSARKEDWVLCRVFYKSRGLSPKPNTTGFYYDDGASSSSLPPLTDTYINFEQPPQPLGNGFNERVPCFSSILRHPSPAAVPAFSHPQPPHLLPDVKSLPLPSDQLGSSSILPGVGPSFLHNPLMSFSSGTDNSGDAVLDHICKGEADGGTAGEDLGVSSGSFLAQAGPHSMWNPF